MVFRESWYRAKYLLHVITLVLVIIVTTARSVKPPEQVILERIFQDGTYDRRVRPVNRENSSAPVFVSINLFLRNVDKLDDMTNEFSVQLTFRQQWKDDRLSYSPTGGVKHISLLNPQTEIWQPDTFFANEKQGKYHELMMRNEFVRIFPNGEVMQSVRISLKLSCPMTFRKFPLDKQECPIRLASYGYTSNQVKYNWEKVTPVQVADKLDINFFVLEGLVTSYCDSITTTGAYSCLRVDFSFKRIFSPYLIHVYIPSTMLVICGWLSLWVSVKAVTGRMVLITLSLFVLSIQTLAVNKTFPPSGRTRAVDMWTGIMLTFVMACLVEFIIIQYIARREETSSSKGNAETCANDDEHRDEEQEIPLKDMSQGDEKGDAGQASSPDKIPQRARKLVQNYVSNYESLPEKIDAVCRVALPILFVFFNIIYWPAYAWS